MYFAELIESRKWGYAEICTSLDCITTMSETMNINPRHISILLDTKYIGIDHAYRVYMADGSVEIINPHGGSVVYSETGKEMYEEDLELRDRARGYVHSFTVRVTGARGGDLITGFQHKMTNGAIIKIVSGVVSPSKENLDLIRQFPDLWKRFIDKLAIIDHYNNISPVARAVWLFDHERSGEYDIVDTPSIIGVDEIYLQIIDVGMSTMLTIDADQLDVILEGNEEREDRAWKGLWFRDQFPKKPGSSARRHTLIFFPHLWKVGTPNKETREFKGPAYDHSLKRVVHLGEATSKTTPNKNPSVPPSKSVSPSVPPSKSVSPSVPPSKSVSPSVIVIEGIAHTYVKKKKDGNGPQRRYEVDTKRSIGIIGIGSSDRLDANAVLIELGETQQDIDNIKWACRNFTAGLYKSLLQKIIRYAPETISFDIAGGFKKTINARSVLRMVFTLLLAHPGAFLPDIKRFVTGQESALKRLLITIYEDSYEPNQQNLLHLAMLSLFAQRVVGWKIGKDDYLLAIELCDRSLVERRTFKYVIDHGRELSPYILGPEARPLEAVSAIIDEVKSFETDEAMCRHIARMGGKYVEADPKRERPELMHLSHCIDQHSAPEIAFFLPMDVVERFRDPGLGSEPFRGLFGTIFCMVTGVNSRLSPRLSSKGPDDDRFIGAVVEAQELVLFARQHKSVPHSPDSVARNGKGRERTHWVSWRMDRSWIAGLVGTIMVPGKPAVMVTMRPDDPYQLVVMRRPSRGGASKSLESISDERTEEAIAAAKDILSIKGVTFRSSNPPVEWLSRYTIKLDRSAEPEKLIFYDPADPRTVYEWEALEYIEDHINLYIPPEGILGEGTGREHRIPEWEEQLYYGGTDGIIDRAQTTLKSIIMDYTATTIRRALSYISANHIYVEVARISKSGGGTAQTVILEDVGAYQILLAISYLYPKAMQREDGYVSKFIIKYIPLMDEIRGILREEIHRLSFIKSGPRSALETWGRIEDRSGRVARSYQTDTHEEMRAKREAGKKGHFIWIPGGMGKTMIVLTYLRELIETSNRPKYIIYALPSSAIKSIFTEIEYFGFSINYMRPIKVWKQAPFVAEYTYSHDTLLEGYINVIEHDDLRKIQDELAIKAADSVFVIDEVHKALNDSKRTDTALMISRLSQDFIAMTGTPIVDTNTYKLIWWLEQIVEFEVNEKNFWVAANGMIAKKVNTGVIVNRKDVEAKMNSVEMKQYRSLVPMAIGGTNPRASDKDIREAFELSYKPCDREIVNLVNQFIETGCMVVTRSQSHQERIRAMLIKSGVVETDIYIMGSGESIFMTDDSVESGETPDYKVVIVTKRQAEGYTLTRLKTFITGVYPSNNATREQLELRINRISQRAKEINYRTVHSGILTYVLQKHKDAATIAAILSAIAKDVTHEL